MAIMDLKVGKKEPKHTSVWMDTTPSTEFPPLEGTSAFDVVVIGGGLLGLNTAYFLAESGVQVALIEMDKIGQKVSGFTTAKITSSHGYIYNDLIKRVGFDKASLYALSNQQAISNIEKLIKLNSIDCDFIKREHFLFTARRDSIKKIEKEAKAALKIGLPVEFTREAEFDFVRAAVKFSDQAQFHPRKYMLGLAKSIRRKGGQIFEQTRVLSVKGKEGIVETGAGLIHAGHIVIASGFPFFDTGRFFTKLYPYRSYAIGAETQESLSGNMYYGIDGDDFSLRTQQIGQKTLAIVGGVSHKAGQGGDTVKRYEDLERIASNRLNIKSIDYFWSAQDNSTPDNLPFVGRSPGYKNIFLGTGFGGWGMTNTFVAARLITDLILNKENETAELLRPDRNVGMRVRSFLGENVNSVKKVVSGKVKRVPVDFPSSIRKGEGKIIQYGGEKIAVYRDYSGKLHALNPKCSHMGCIVAFNNAEKTWDCPCHGSRYEYDGRVIQGPATEDLQNKEL